MRESLFLLALLLFISNYPSPIVKAEEIPLASEVRYDILTTPTPFVIKIEEPEPLIDLEKLNKVIEYEAFVDCMIAIATSQPQFPVKRHETIYGAYFGNPTAQWCTEFVMYCLKQTETTLDSHLINSIYPWKDSAWNTGLWYKRHNRYYQVDEQFYIPHRGDIILFDTDHYGYPNHTGYIIDSYKEDGQYYVVTIEGNIPTDTIKQVRSRTLPINEDSIFAYCSSLYESEYHGYKHGYSEPIDEY